MVGNKTLRRPIVLFRAERHLIENPNYARLVERHSNGSLTIIGKEKVGDYAAVIAQESNEMDVLSSGRPSFTVIKRWSARSA
jgi:hypothetical protein